MKKAYIILAHHNQDQLLRLLQRLDDGASCFFLHVDKKYPLDGFIQVINQFNKNLVIVDRVEIEWAGFGMVEATLNAMRAIHAHKEKFSWISLLSGMDYPIKSNDFIDHFYNSTHHCAFIDYTKLPDDKRWQPRGGYFRIDKYFFGLKTRDKLTAKAFNFLGNYLPFIRRKLLRKMQPYAGSQWWTIDEQVLSYVLNYVEENPHYYSFHKHTFAADEVFFHSIILNAAEELTARVANNNKRFMIWPDTSVPHPTLLGKKDYEAIEKSDALFARKFDVTKDDEILDLIDDRLLGIQQTNHSFQQADS